MADRSDFLQYRCPRCDKRWGNTSSIAFKECSGCQSRAFPKTSSESTFKACEQCRYSKYCGKHPK